VSRVSAKRIALIAAAGLALVSAIAMVMLHPDGLMAARGSGLEAFEWAVPLAAGLFVGLSAWVLLGDPESGDRGASHTETHCPACGRVILCDWRLCPHCGALISADVEGAAGFEAEARH